VINATDFEPRVAGELQRAAMTPTTDTHGPGRCCTHVDTGSALCQARTMLDALAELCKQGGQGFECP